MSLSIHSGKAEERRGVGRLGALAVALGVALTVLFAQATPARAADHNGTDGAEALRTALGNKATVDNDTVQLTGNAELENPFWVNVNTTLDLNGHTLTIKTAAEALYVGHASTAPTLTIKNTNADAEGKIVREEAASSASGIKGVIEVGATGGATGNVIIKGGTIDGLNLPGLYVRNGEATLDGGKVLGGGLVATSQARAVYVKDSSTLTVNDGAIDRSGLLDTAHKPHLGGGVFPVGTGAKVVVNGGSITGANAISTNGSLTKGAQITIKGGSLGCTDVKTTEPHAIYSAAVYLPSAKDEPQSVNSITVTGGKIEGGIGILSLGSNVTVEPGDGEKPGPLIVADSENTEDDGCQAGDAKYGGTKYVKYPPSAIVIARVTNYGSTGEATLSGGTFQATKGPAVVSVTVDTAQQSAETGLKVTNENLDVTGGTYSTPVNPSYLKDVKAFVAVSTADAKTFSYFTDEAKAEEFAAAQDEADSVRVVPVSVADGMTVIMGFAADAEAAKAGIAEAAEAVGWDPANIPGKDSVKNTMWVVYKTSPNATTTVNFTEGGHQVYPATAPFNHSTREPGYGAVWFTLGPGNSNDAKPSDDYLTPKVGTYKVEVVNTGETKSAHAELELSSATFKPTDGAWATDNPVAPYTLVDGNAVAFFAAGQAIADPGTVAAEGKTFKGWNPAPTTAPEQHAELTFSAQWEDVAVDPDPDPKPDPKPEPKPDPDPDPKPDPKPEPKPDPDPDPKPDPKPEPGMVVVHRLYNQYEGTHLYTTSENEVAALVELGWTDEGAFWQAPELNAGDHNVVRLYNPFNGDHYYLSENDEPQQEVLLELGWKLDGEDSWFGSASPDTGIEVVTLFNPFSEVDTHLYTPDANEVTELLLLGWQEHTTVIWASALPA